MCRRGDFIQAVFHFWIIFHFVVCCDLSFSNPDKQSVIFTTKTGAKAMKTNVALSCSLKHVKSYRRTANE